MLLYFLIGPKQLYIKAITKSRYLQCWQHHNGAFVSNEWSKACVLKMNRNLSSVVVLSYLFIYSQFAFYFLCKCFFTVISFFFSFFFKVTRCSQSHNKAAICCFFVAHNRFYRSFVKAQDMHVFILSLNMQNAELYLHVKK